ncbi:MAG: TOBE domain-containing protein [Planctomycetota bacterium]|jgi:hypothetical protein|nr:TOBE domain-containing protein [Planctomycetota bacterium]
MNFLSGWRLDSGLARRGVNSLAPARPPAGGRRRITLAIRPEDVRIGRDGFAANQLLAHVEDVEFKGSSYRVGLKILNDGAAGRAERLDAVMPPRDFVRLGLRRAECVTATLPAESLLCFDEPDPDETLRLDGMRR